MKKEPEIIEAIEILLEHDPAGDPSPVLVNDHDFRSDAGGVGISYCIYDPPHNRRAVCVGISHDTPAFAVHSIATWWKREGPSRYGRVPKLLATAAC